MLADVKNSLLIILAVYLLAVAYLYINQRSFIYFPQATSPAAVQTNFEITNDGVVLRGWVINRKSRDAIIYFGGNGERVEVNLPLFRQIFSDKAVFMVAYRGYGDSEGAPSEAALNSDATAIYDQIKSQYKSISIIGRSLGAGIATNLASTRPTEKLILITPFSSVEDIAGSQFPIFPVSLLLKDKDQSVQRA